MANVGSEIAELRQYKTNYDNQVIILNSHLVDWLNAFQSLVDSLEGNIKIKLEELLVVIRTRLFADYSAEYLAVSTLFETIASNFTIINGGEK